MSQKWSRGQFDQVKRILMQHKHVTTAAGVASEKLGLRLTRSSIKNAFARAGEESPSTYLIGGSNNPSDKEPADTPVSPFVGHPRARKKLGDTSPIDALLRQLKDADRDLVIKLVARTKRRPVRFEDACNFLNLPPKRARDLLDTARSAGVNISIQHGQIELVEPEPSFELHDLDIPPVVGKKQRCAVISDLHFGSKYCLRKQLREFIHNAYGAGITEILCPGDFLDGIYRHGIQELRYHTFDGQCEDAYRSLPQLPGLTYTCIAGNHDATFWDKTGHDPGHAIESWFRHPPDFTDLKGRSDVRFIGHRGAFVHLRGANIHMWHPKKGAAYAKSYHLQKLSHMYSSSEKPHISLAGHWHIFNYCVERGVHLVACPTFQGGGSAYGKSLGGAPEIGGLILSWQLTEHGTMRTFGVERVSYFETERTRNIKAFEKDAVYQGLPD